MIRRAILVTPALLAAAACSRSIEAPAQQAAGGDLHAVLWIQTAAEHRAACLQTFAAARSAVDRALADPTWSAAFEQRGEFSQKPPAIIVDVDETVVDNSAYNARLLQEHGKFELASWNAWVGEARAGAVPGAKAFLEFVAERGVTVFYVTNRASEVEAATRANLVALGFPIGPSDIDTVLTRNDHDDAGSEKSPRRERIAETHRVLLLLGDDLGDFVPHAREASRKARKELTERFANYWGERWFMLPNPMYGSWLSALGEDPSAGLDPSRSKS